MSEYSVYFKSLVTILAFTVLFALISLPLIYRKISRNGLYGFRTRKTLSSDAIWYEANAYFGRSFLIANCSSAVMILVLYFFQQQLPPERFTNFSLAIFVVPSLIAVILTFLFVHSLNKKL